ncbi:MAG: ABC-F family ATP-binding cassette domain-containing protein [Ilumatobacter sp.]|uniref:ABC-F family ATP-binding cassette domain-containing protein n=1 Tax=Ilumatobacter sp. TaxID=1967498 RepID=UPI003C795238
MICVDASGVHLAQPDKVLFDDLDVTVSRGDRVAVVGVNGSGKTTLLRILTGALEPDRGDVRFGRGARITMLEQDPVLPPGTVEEYLGDGWEVAAVATSLGVQPLFGRPTDELSGGQAKRVALAKMLADNSGSGDAENAHDMIVLDEPTNHLDLEAIEWLEARLVSMSAALVLVTHDRHALDRLTTQVGPSKVVELDHGRSFVHQAAAGSSAYATYLDARAERVEREEQEESTRKILARKELAWLRRGAPARTAKPKARLRTANEIVSGGPRDLGVRANSLELGVGTARLGNQVVELIDVGQQFENEGGEPTTIFQGVDLVIEPGARLAVVGPNGSGKTTLLDIIAARREPVLGEIRTGKTVVVGYADQHSASLDPDMTVRKMVAGPLREPDHEDKALLEKFWFDSTAQYAPVRMLSGGEKRRLQMVMVLARQPNLLLLDEPTNDLDLDTLRSLEEFLDDWPGALVVASHDRAFLDRVADHVLAIEPGGSMRRVPGGVRGWLEERAATGGGARSGAPAAPKAKKSATSTKATGGSGKPKAARTGPSPSTIGRRLRETEQSMVKAQKRVDSLNAELASATDHAVLADRGAVLAEAQTELSDLEAAWLELAEQAET